MAEKHTDALEKFLESRPPQNPDDVWRRVEILQNRILQYEKIMADHQQQTKKFFKDEDSNVVSQFIALKEENIQLKSQKLDVEYKLDESEVKLRLLNAEWQSRLESEKKAITDQFSSERKEIVKELDDTKKVYEAKLRELYNELQLNQATSAMQLDEVESNLKQHLIQTADKLRESNSSCLTLRSELQNLKLEYSYFKANSNQKISDLKCKLMDAFERSSYSSLHSDRPREHSSDFVMKKKEVVPLRSNLYGKSSGSLKSAKVSVQLNEPSSTTSVEDPKVVDPPKQPKLSPKKSGRKRKLYNPDDPNAFFEEPTLK